MKTQKKHAQVFLVLVPHRDTRLVLRNYSSLLFKAGAVGAYHFPWVAPFAALSQPFSADELKHCARFLRKAAGEGKINAMDAAVCPFMAEGTKLFGPRIDIGVSNDIFGEDGARKITIAFSPQVIGACLLSAGEDTAVFPLPPPLSFRAAAVANMYWWTLRTDTAVIGYKWKIGKLFWLPKKAGGQ